MVRIDTQEIIPVDRKLIIGRHPRCDYIVAVNDENAGVSGRHASIEVEGDYAWIEDLGSSNGTWVRGARIERRTPLLPGERFLLDRLEFEFRAAASSVTVLAPMAEKTVLAGLNARNLPPVPLSIEDSAPRLAPVIMAAPVLTPAAAARPSHAASRDMPERRHNTAPRRAVPAQARASRPVAMYALVLGCVALAGAVIALLLSRS